MTEGKIAFVIRFFFLFKIEIKYQVAKNHLESLLWKSLDKSWKSMQQVPKPEGSKPSKLGDTGMLATSRRTKDEIEELDEAAEKFENVWEELKNKDQTSESPRGKPKRKVWEEDEHLKEEVKFKREYMKLRKGRINFINVYNNANVENLKN